MSVEHTESRSAGLGNRHILVSDAAFPLVHFNAYFEGGPSFDPIGMEGLTCLTNRMLIRGTQAYSRVEFEDLVESMGTELVTSTRADAMTLGGTVLAEHFPSFVERIGEAYRAPASITRNLRRHVARCSPTLNSWSMRMGISLDIVLAN